MTARIQPERRDEILDAALALLREQGLAGVTTAALAKAARCSKVTLYRLFEDRAAILAALVDRQASTLNATLTAAPGPASPDMALAQAGAQLLRLLTSEASLAINRAALADPTGELSRILIQRGKERSAPKIASLIAQLHEAGLARINDGQEAYRIFYGLLVGDRQILALHGARYRPEDPEGVARRAVGDFLRLHPSNEAK
jgi:AcrR family transcriptional regulator